MTSSLEIPIDAGAVTSEALSWPDRARATVITDSTTYTDACELLKGIKALRVRIGETFDPHIGRAFQAHRALCKEKQDAEAPLTEAERILKAALVAYDDAQERIRRAKRPGCARKLGSPRSGSSSRSPPRWSSKRSARTTPICCSKRWT
jgi:hypothetical protein